MSSAIRTATVTLLRFLALWVLNTLSLYATARLLPGMAIAAVGATPAIQVAVAAALLLAMINLLLRPIILLIARPLGWIALFIVGFLLNAVALWLTAWLLPGFEADFISSIVGGIVFAFFNAILTGILELDDEGSFYQNQMERRAREQAFAGANQPGRGLMMLEIDGLSYWHLQKALADGLLPTLQQMIDEDGYAVTRVDCGLPSMTSACQAGIMFGDNYDIPAFRWYDKQQGKLYVSEADAAELNARYAHGQGLMRDGSSIMNMLDGDAEKSMFTLANIRTGSKEERRRRADDVALLMLNPYFLTRSLAIFFWEVGRELWEGWQQKRNDVQPRLNRLERGYPFLRAALCTLMRDISANIAILDMMRGAPSIYMLYLGYDEVAHHSGPWTSDAFGDLKRLDKTLARLRRALKERAPRPYDLIILSDHGQSFGATFLQRYGMSIKEFIEQQLPKDVSVAQAIGGDTGVTGLQGVASELANIQESHAGGAMGRAVAKQGQKLAEQGVKAGDELTTVKPASVTAYGSGNAAHVYFDLLPRKITLNELNSAYPKMVDALIQHEGIGMVIGYDDDMSAVVLGKGGQRNLNTGEVVGEDPVAPYARADGYGAGSLEKRIWQLKRVMDFPHAGDLWLISTLYADGTVAALEELVGNHGGLGGEQTDAFIFHPPDMEVTETRNSTDVFHILNNHRGKPVAEKPPVAEQEKIADWAPANLLKGVGQVGVWVGLALRCLFLDREAYQAVVNNPYMTGPALLIGLASTWLIGFVRSGDDLPRLTSALLLWVLAVALVFAGGWLLTKQGAFTKTLRAMGFGHSVYLLSIFALAPAFSTVVNSAILAWGFLCVWMGAATAHQTKGWRTLLLPLVVLLVYVIGGAIVGVLLAGAGFTFQSLLAGMGIQPQ